MSALRRLPDRGTVEWKRLRRDAAERLRYANSYTRMGAVIALWPLMRQRTWLRILGREWSGCDNIAYWLPLLRKLLANLHESELAYMMTREERERWAQLPTTFIAFRGCYLELNRDGVSHSLDRETAEKFAGHFHRYRARGTPVLVTSKCRRSRSIIKLDRGEQEVIALHRQIVSVDRLPAYVDCAEAAA